MYFKKKVPDFRISTYVSTILLFDYYKAFISHKNLHSPMLVLFTKIPKAWPVILSMFY